LGIGGLGHHGLLVSLPGNSSHCNRLRGHKDPKIPPGVLLTRERPAIKMSCGCWVTEAFQRISHPATPPLWTVPPWTETESVSGEACRQIGGNTAKREFNLERRNRSRRSYRHIFPQTFGNSGTIGPTRVTGALISGCLEHELPITRHGFAPCQRGRM
jgi:hypothetical protein